MGVQIAMAVGVGGFIGAIGRFTISGWVQKAVDSSFPYGTLAVNIIGSFMIGFLVPYFEYHLSPHYRAFVVTGLLGALTTFSTFTMETVVMIEDSLYQRVFINISLNVILCIGATVLGMILFRKIYGL